MTTPVSRVFVPASRSGVLPVSRNSSIPPPTKRGWIMKWSSSRSWCSSSVCPSGPWPYMTRGWPSCCLSPATAAAGSPRMLVVLVQSAFSKVEEKTYFADAGHPVGVAAGCGARHRREHLICPPAHQHRVAVQQLLQRGLFGLGAEVLAGPGRRVPDDAVDRHQGGFNDFPRDGLPCLVVRSPVPLRGELEMPAAEAACAGDADCIDCVTVMTVSLLGCVRSSGPLH